MNKNLSLVKNNFEELPNNIEAEQSVLWSILLQNEIFDEINTIISNKVSKYLNIRNYLINQMVLLCYK